MIVTFQDVYHDLIITLPLLLWIFFVIQYLSRWVYDFALKKGYPKHSATYFGRKIIHIFAAGVMTLFLPFFFREPFVPFVSGLLLGLYNYYFRRTEKLQDWYQVRENHHEVNFCIMWSLSILIGWFIDKSFWLGVIPALFMAFGDGITGIVRNFKYTKRNKAWEGSVAMFFTCAVIGGLKMGWAGIIAAVGATFFEEFNDDNIFIPLVSFITLTLFLYFSPGLTEPFI